MCCLSRIKEEVILSFPGFPRSAQWFLSFHCGTAHCLNLPRRFSNFQHFRAISMRGIANWNCQYVSPNFLMANGFLLLARLFGFEVIRLSKLFHLFNEVLKQLSIFCSMRPSKFNINPFRLSSPWSQNLARLNQNWSLLVDRPRCVPSKRQSVFGPFIV